MFRFTIRDVLWLTVVVAVLAAWAMDHWSQVSRYTSLADQTFQIEINGGHGAIGRPAIPNRP